MRLSFIEGICLVAMGVAMVELQDGQRFGRPGSPGTATATAAKPAAAAGVERLQAVAQPGSNEGYR